MNEPLTRFSDGRPEPSYQDVVHRDGGRVPDVLELQSNPPRSTDDIAFERYTSHAFFDREMEKMWRKVWQFACREEHIPEVGDYHVYDLGPYSFIVTRVADNDIRAYYNACLHRGTKLRASGTEGNTAEFKCSFHGWTWNLDGSHKETLCHWDFPHVDPEKYSLPQARVETLGGFVFINMDPGCQPLDEFLTPVKDLTAKHEFEKLRYAWYRTVVLPAKLKDFRLRLMDWADKLVVSDDELQADGVTWVLTPAEPLKSGRSYTLKLDAELGPVITDEAGGTWNDWELPFHLTGDVQPEPSAKKKPSKKRR